MMALIAWRLPNDRAVPVSSPGLRAEPEGLPGLRAEPEGSPGRSAKREGRAILETRALLLAVSLGFVAFSYGAMTSFSAMFADDLGIRPRSLFLTAMAVAIVVSRLLVGRRIDVIGHRRALLPSLFVAGIGLVILTGAQGAVTFGAAAAIFGAGFGLMFPAFAAYLMTHIDERRRGAAYGAMIAAFDTGIGTGSSTMGWLIHRFGFRGAIGIAAVIALAAVPYFLVMEKRLGYR
jgi:predicted MFS family arabinose efflux permease